MAKTSGRTNGHTNGKSKPPAIRAPAGGIRLGGKFYREGTRLPALYSKNRYKDPAADIDQAPPNFGRDLLPTIITFSGRQSQIAQIYRNPDQAIRESAENARFMRNDTTIMECLEARQRATALLNWHLEPEDKKDKRQLQLVEDMTRVVKAIPDFTEYRRNLLEALWYGRYANQHAYGFEQSGFTDPRRTVISRWVPINGDKLLFRWDDGSGKYLDGQIGIRVGNVWSMHDAIAGDRQLEYTDQGPGYFLEPWERTRLAVHKHIIEDGAYEDSMSAGRIHGVGIRDRIYWTWFQKQETMAHLMEVIERTGTGFTIYRYPAGNPQAKREVEALAKEQTFNNIILLPAMPGDPTMDAYGIERIEPNTAGIEALFNIVHNFFGAAIKRYILGQLSTSEAVNGGIGSGQPDLHAATFGDIISYDSVKLEETITRETVKPLKDFNYAWAKDIPLRFVIDTKSPDAEEKLAAMKQAWEMGAELKAQDVMDMIGASIPTADDKKLFNPTILQQIRLWHQQQAQEGMGGGAGQGQPGSIEDMFGPLAGQLQGGDGGEGGGDVSGGMDDGGGGPPNGSPDPGGSGGGGVGTPQQYAKVDETRYADSAIRARLGKIADKTTRQSLGTVRTYWPRNENLSSKIGNAPVIYDPASPHDFHADGRNVRVGPSALSKLKSADRSLGGMLLREISALAELYDWTPPLKYAHKPGKGQGAFTWNEDDHPREPKGKSEHGGEFVAKGEGDGGGGQAQPVVTSGGKKDWSHVPASAAELAKHAEVSALLTKHGLKPKSIEDWLAYYREESPPEEAESEELEPPESALVVEPEPEVPQRETSKPPDTPKEMERNITEAITSRLSGAIQDFGEKIGGARKDLVKPTGPKEKKPKEPVDERPAWARRYHIAEIAKSSDPNEDGKFAIYDEKDLSPWGKPRQKGPMFATREAAEKSLPLLAVARNHRTYDKSKSGEEPNWAIVRKVTDRKFPIVRDGFSSDEEAMRYMASHPEEIIEHKFPSWEDDSYLDHVERTGTEHRKGDIDTAEFQKSFGFRGGEFGKWQMNKSGQVALNHGFDALHDLAESIGLPSKAMSLDGQLSLGLGSRGHGLTGAKAHYEPGKVPVINLTKMHGAGSLAHEWFHALDNYVAKIALGKSDTEHLLTNGTPYEHANRGRKEVNDAWNHLVDVMRFKNVTSPIEAKHIDKVVQRQEDHVAQSMKNIEDQYKSYEANRGYFKKFKPFTNEQQSEWDSLKFKVLTGDVGEKLHIPTKGPWGGSLTTYANVQKMNEIFKKATGRFFHTNAEHSYGKNLIHHIINKDAAKARLAMANQGATETRKTHTNYIHEAKKLDETRVGDYYSLPHELAARAFAAYVEDKINEKGYKSEYLTARSHNRYYRFDKPYPEFEERASINAAFDKLFETLKKEPRSDEKGEHVRLYGKDGRPTLYVRPPGRKRPLRPSPGQQELIPGSIGGTSHGVYREELHPREHGRWVEKDKAPAPGDEDAPLFDEKPKPKQAVTASMPESFVLQPTPTPKPSLKQSFDTNNAIQQSLWHGLNDLPGQMKLFEGMDLGVQAKPHEESRYADYVTHMKAHNLEPRSKEEWLKEARKGNVT